MALSEAQKRAVAKYNAKSYDRLELKVAKGKKDVIQGFAEQQGKSETDTLKKPLRAKLKRIPGKISICNYGAVLFRSFFFLQLK